MKVLQVNILFGNGSTGKIVNDIHNVLLLHNNNSIVCYGAGDDIKSENVNKLTCHYELSAYRLWSHFTGLQFASGFISTYRLIKIIKQEEPDIVHLHCINGFFINVYKVMNFLKKNNINTVLSLHAEFMYTGSCGHSFDCEKWKTGCGNCPQLWDATYSWFFDRTEEAWIRMNNAFENFDNIIVTTVSPWLTSRAKLAPILKGKRIITIENGVDTTNVFFPRNYNDLKERLNMGDARILLHVTANFSDRIDDLKGGRYILELAKYLENSNVKIIVIGPTEPDVRFPENIIYIGRIDDQSVLAQYYSMADLTVITSKKETFSMPVAESLSCGTPVVGFASGGPETISIEEYSEFVEYGNVNDLSLCVSKWLDFKKNRHIQISETARNLYSKERMTNRYMNVYKLFDGTNEY